MCAWPPYPYLATRGRACSLKLSYCNQISNIIQRTDKIVAIDMACLRTHSVLELIKILFTLIGCFYRFKSFRLPAIPAGWKRVPSPHPSAGIQSRFHTLSLKIGIWVGDPDYWDYWTIGIPYLPTFFHQRQNLASKYGSEYTLALESNRVNSLLLNSTPL